MLVPVGPHSTANAPKRILLINGAHIGDVVIATSLIPVLKSAYPNAEIGFLTGSWSHPVVAKHPDVSFAHCADHWRMNRAEIGFAGKRLRYLRSRRQALKGIRSVGYDLSISMHPWRADFLPLAWQAGIPNRVAFGESIFAPLASALAEYPEHERFIHQSECQLRLLRAWGISQEDLSRSQPTLAPSVDSEIQEVCRLLGFTQINEAPYIVIQMGAGSSVRELPLSFWREVVERVSTRGRVLLTGKGIRERANADQVKKGLTNCINACDMLSWSGLVAAIRYAREFYGLDSMAGHVAAAVGTRCTAIYGGMNNLARFRPLSDKATVWARALPCSACNRQNGCVAMTCMQGFEPDQILQIRPKEANA